MTRGDDLVAAARSAFVAALEACDVERAVAANVDAVRAACAGVDDVRVLAIGKASDALVRGVARALASCGVPESACRGLAVAHVPTSNDGPRWVRRIVGGHPIPDARSFAAGEAALAFVTGATERTLLIFCASGGGSALVERPIDECVGVARLAALNDAMIRADLDIRAINAVRKRVSAIKGGRLALAAAPARVLTLVVSDVAPGDPGSVASGPTALDETTLGEAEAALVRVPEAVRLALVETPHADELERIRSELRVLLDCTDVARAAARAISPVADEVIELGCVDGPLDEVVRRHLDALDGASDGRVVAVVSVGEATLEVTGDGFGGRNQQTVLAALVAARGRFDGELAVLSVGTDGRDGPTDAAGAATTLAAIGDGAEARSALERFDAYPYLDRLGALVRTGPTGTNLRDLRIFLRRQRVRSRER